jgi:hypothetical protein
MLTNQITLLPEIVADVVNGFTEWLTRHGQAPATIRRFLPEQRNGPRRGRRCNESLFELCFHLLLSDSDRTAYYAARAGTIR